MTDSSQEYDKLRDLLEANKHKGKTYLNTLFFCPPKLIGTPLSVACWNLNVEAAKLLIEYGADVNTSDLNETSVLMNVLRLPDFMKDKNNDRLKQMVKLLIDKGADVNASNSRYCVLDFAVKCDVEIVELLIEANANVNSRTFAGRTPLMLCGSPEIARLLINNGALVNAQDDFGQTALMYHFDKSPIMKELIDSGANIYHKDLNGKCTLEHCVIANSTVEILFLSKICLEYLFKYFNDISSDLLRQMVTDLIRDPSNEDKFIINTTHLTALSFLNRSISENVIKGDEGFMKDFSFIFYFNSSDFQDKLWDDVILRLDENNIEIDGQTLRGKRVRTKSKSESEEILTLLRFVNEKRKLAEDFYDLTESLIKNLNKQN